MLKMKLQYLGHLMKKVDLLEKIPMLRKTEGKRRRGSQRMGGIDNIADSMNMNLSKLWESGGQRRLACYSPRSHKELNMTLRLIVYQQ